MIMTKYLTAEGLEKLKKELEYLEKVKMREIAERLKHAISQGDLRENAGYAADKEEQAFVEGRIRELRETIGQARVIEKKENGVIQIGSSVLLNLDRKEQKFQIVSPEETDVLNNKISFKSPLGEQLMGKKKGESVKVNTPEGKKEYNIIEVK